MKEKTRLRTTKRQLETLITFMENNRELSENAKLSQNEGESSAAKWCELRNMLNNLEGPTRTVKEWKQVFADLKTNTRRRARLKKYDLLKTGGGKSNEKDLTPLEERIINLVSKVSIDGVPGVSEPGLSHSTHVDEVEAENVLEILETPSQDLISATDSQVICTLGTDAGKSPVQPPNSPPVMHHKKRKLKTTNVTNHSSMADLINSQNHLATAINNLAQSIMYLAKRARY